MPSPVLPSDFCSLTPTPATDPCEAVKRIFFEQPALICSLLQYMFDSDGNPTDDFLQDVQQVPPGLVTYYAANNAPDGWLICDGREVSRTTYASLYSIIGTIYGSGDTVTTFNLPDLAARFVVGRDATDATYTLANTGGSASAAALLAHRHGYGRFEGGEDNVWLKTGGYTAPEDMLCSYVRGDGESRGYLLIPEDTVLPDDDQTQNASGLLTSLPVDDDTAEAGANLPPYIVLTAIIKT